MRYVAIYVRKSRLKEEDGIELNKQLELLTDYAEKKGFTYDIYKEQGSSEDWNRPEFQKLIKMIDKDAYSGVLVTDLDRITRDRVDFGLFTRKLSDKDMKLITLSKTYDFEQDEDIFISGIQSEMDNQFMRIVKRKLRRGKYQAVNSGVWIGVAPLGYMKDSKTKKLVPAEDGTKELVQLIYNRFTEDQIPIADICREIEARGLAPYGKSYIADSTVRRLLKNVVYKGTLRYKDHDGSYIVLDDMYPAIISKEQFTKAQELWKDRSKNPKRSQVKHPLSGIVVCAKCGNRLTMTRQRFKDSEYKSIASCKTSKHRTKMLEDGYRECSNTGMRYYRLQEAVVNAIREDIKEVDEQLIKTMAGDIDVSEEEAKVQQMRDTINKLEGQKKKVQQGFISGIFDEKESQDQIASLNSQMESIKYELANTTIVTPDEKIDRIREILNAMEHATLIDWFKDPHETNKILKSFIKTIHFSKDIPDSRKAFNPFEILIEYH